MRYIVTILSLLLSLTGNYAQKEDYNWFIDINQDGNIPVQGLLLDWNRKNSNPKPIDLPYGIDNNNASICDKDGNLLFWSNGCAVMNREQAVMPHGDTMNWDSFKIVIGWNNCQYGYPGPQNIKILPDPGYEHGYYIIHKAWKYNGQFEDITYELRHSYVDMTLDHGLGDVVYFDSILYHGRVTMSNLEAIYQKNSKNWYIIQPKENDSIFLIYQINENGITQLQDQNSHVYFKFLRSGAGTMRLSPDGTKLAYYDYFLNLHVYDFDRTAGLISNHRKVVLFDDAESKPDDQYRFGSVEWSPNSRFMYVAIDDSLFQVDSYEQNMQDGVRLIDVYNGTWDPFPTTFYIASLAPDCKIYICSTNGTQSYHIIHRPDELGTDCHFVQNGLKLPQSSGSANLPLFPRFRVDEVDKCDSTISSVFGQAVFYRRPLIVYPSPSAGRYHIDIPQEVGSGTIQVFNLNGQVILEKRISIGTSKVDIDITHQPSGMYHVEIYPEKNPQRIFWGQQVVKVD
jgi:hypothetical protein